MTVSFCVIAYNEERYINRLLNDLCKQDYPHDQIEVVLVDGNSSDRTKDAMCDFAAVHQDFLRVVVLNNSKRTLPCGWNEALSEVKCDIILRVDAHASIPEDFISQNVKCIASGEYVCGGYRPCVLEDDSSKWQQVLLTSENSAFGSSIASYRRKSERRHVKSVFHGAYRKTVFDTVGKFNEYLTRTEDNEMHYRIRKAGFLICFDPSIQSYQFARPSLAKMLRQKYLNGYWIGRTLFICPKCLSIFHIVPLCFIIGILTSSVFALFGVWQLALAMWGCYWLLAIIMSICSLKFGPKSLYMFFLPVLFFLIHICYGVGTVIGIGSLVPPKGNGWCV